MGMAASQARYLALAARKTNTEWEGQQINQARTALANQSANLFNRLLGLDVPTAPQTSDYTEIQYSYSDGTNESVIDSWEQLSNSDPNYNYVVNHYYLAEVYRGSQKLMQDPQVQAKEDVKTKAYINPSVVQNRDGSFTITHPDGFVETCAEITSAEATSDAQLEQAFNDFAVAKELAYQAGAIPTGEVYGYQDATGTWHFYLKEEMDAIEEQQVSIEWDSAADSYTITSADGMESNTYESLANVTMDENLEAQLRDFESAMGLAKADGTLTTDAVYGYQDSDGTWHFFLENDLTEPKDYSMRTLATYVGNSPLTHLDSLTNEQVTELAQILKDCPDSAMKEYISFDSSGNLLYSGEGIYTFDIHGTTYFTTQQDLMTSLNSPYNEERPIDIQEKLAYYKASYVEERIEQKNYALLETDEKGRFTTVKFDNDSMVYSLNVETVTDQEAYQDAMNEYMYKKELYEKTIADINAQTSIIHQEDRTLELRLKQLDTEQNALATEMDAVKKVIKDNVEKTFKTFGD